MRLNWKGTFVDYLLSIPLASLVAGESVLTESGSQTCIITGAKGTGKTTFCHRFIQQIQGGELSLGGILSQAQFEGGRKTGIYLENLRTGEQCLLGCREPGAEYTLEVGCWYFNPEVLAWGNSCLEAAAGSDVVIFDECGFLELEHGKGFQAGLNVIDAQDFKLGVVVVRPSLLSIAQARWPEAVVIDLDEGRS